MTTTPTGKRGSADSRTTHFFIIAYTPYGFMHHRSQRIADRLCAMGFPVTYVEFTYGFRAFLAGENSHFLRELLRSIGLHLRACFPVRGVRSLRSNVRSHAAGTVRVVSLPLVIPTNRFNSSILERMNSRVYRLVLDRTVLGSAGSGMRTVAIIDHPLWGCVLRRGDFDSLFYDCIDDISLYARSASLERFGGYEQRLMNLSDGAFVTAQKLEDHLRSLNLGKPIIRIPNGVDVEWFRRRSGEEGCPKDLEQLPRPRVGYIGTIADWIDFSLIERTARAFPEVSFVFIGPLDSSRRHRDLASRPNIRWLGRKPYESVPLYVQGCDVCWIPFAAGRITENTNPIKLFEYFSLGKPVVATGLPEILPFAAGGVVYAGTNAQEICEALRAALAEQSAELPARRLSVARDHSWDGLVQKIVDVTTSTEIRRA